MCSCYYSYDSDMYYDSDTSDDSGDKIMEEHEKRS